MSALRRATVRWTLIVFQLEFYYTNLPRVLWEEEWLSYRSVSVDETGIDLHPEVQVGCGHREDKLRAFSVGCEQKKQGGEQLSRRKRREVRNREGRLDGGSKSGFRSWLVSWCFCRNSLVLSRQPQLSPAWGLVFCFIKWGYGFFEN